MTLREEIRTYDVGDTVAITLSGGEYIDVGIIIEIEEESPHRKLSKRNRKSNWVVKSLYGTGLYHMWEPEIVQVVLARIVLIEKYHHRNPFKIF